MHLRVQQRHGRALHRHLLQIRRGHRLCRQCDAGLGRVAPTSDVRPGSLEGDYAGATAGVTFIVGLGANVLVGGLDKSIALQPVSVQGNTGLNIAAGVGVITLKYDQ